MKTSDCDTTTPEWECKPVEVAALAAAMWMYRDLHDKPSRGQSPTQKTAPSHYVEDAYELLAEAAKVIASKRSEDTLNRSDDERRKADGVYDSARTFSWKELLTRQQQDSQDQNAAAKFCPGKKWNRLKSKIESGRFHFTEKNLLNRPKGFSMLGTITTEKGLRNAVKRLMPDSSAQIIEAKELRLWQVNQILVDQLNRNQGKIPPPRDTKTSPV